MPIKAIFIQIEPDLWCPGQPDNYTDHHGTFETCVVMVHPNRDPECGLNDIPDKARKFICMEVSD